LFKKECIKQLDFFKTLTKDQLNILYSISTIKSYKKDYILCYEKTKNKELLFLIDGLAKSYKIDKNNNEIFLFHIEQSNIISEISTIDDVEFTSYSNIIFIEDSTVLQINYQIFKKTFIDSNILIKEFLNEIIRRSHKLETLINREFIFDAVTKVSMMINSNLDMFNKLKRHDIALILNIQPATLSRVLNKLKKDNKIKIIQGKVIRIDDETN